MKCPRCRHDNPPHAKFCMECAAPLAVRCGACGAVLPPTAKFCLECAASVAAAPGPAVLVSSPRFTTPDAYTPGHLAERILGSRPSLEGERKQVTVLFADLKGSMELLADRDPEDARRLLDPVIERMMDSVHRYEGTVNQVMGDGIMALFGAPLAHEDHAVRACYAALRMQDAIARYAEELRRAQGLDVQVRVGLNSGEVVVRSIGSDLRMDYTAVGQTTHLAARMEQLAAPGSVRLTPETLRLVEGYVEVRALGPVSVKGLTAPIEVYELTGAGSVRTRLQAAGARGFTRFVGRDVEMEQLEQAAGQAGRGRGQIVAVVGEPGVGKSRLYYEFLHSHRAQGWRTLESGSVSYGKAMPYLPLVDLLRSYVRIDARDDVGAIRTKVTDKLLALDESLGDLIPAIFWLLDVLAGDSPFLVLDSAERRRRTLAAIKRIVLRESRAQPVLLVFEDLQWIDSETQDFLDSLVESLPTAAMLLAVNYRPEYQHAWGGKTYYRQLRIDPLPSERAEDLLDGLLGAHPSVAPLKPLLIERTEGNPLFLEESVRTRVETDALAGARGAWRLVTGLDVVRVPATVQAILSARIDRLDAADKRLLQTASVIGRDVPLTLLLAAAGGGDEDELRRGLARLQAAEFVYEARLFPEMEYTFKHALTHEVAYGSLLQDRRRALHRVVLESLEHVYADRLAEHVESLALHAVRGQVRDRAVKYLRQAGERAAARSALRDAAAAFERALGVLAELPETPETLATAADLHLALAIALIPLRGTPAPEVEASYRRARELAERLGDATRLYQALWGLWFVRYAVGRYPVARELGQQLLSVAGQEGNPERILEAHHALWATLSAMGETATALVHLEQGLGLRDPARHAGCPVIYANHDPVACCLYHLALTRWLLGQPARALAATRDAIALAERLAHPPTTVITLTFAAFVLYQCGDYAAAREQARRGNELARSQGFGPWVDDTAVVLACVRARERPDRAGIADAHRQLAGTTGRAAWRNAICLSLLAEAYARVGDTDAGLEVLSAIPEGHRDAIFAPEIHRVRGELLLRRGDRDAAERSLREAIALARRRGERSLELRAATSLARLLATRGAREEAREALAGIYGWFTEGSDTADLATARTLLAELER